MPFEQPQKEAAKDFSNEAVRQKFAKDMLEAFIARSFGQREKQRVEYIFLEGLREQEISGYAKRFNKELEQKSVVPLLALTEILIEQDENKLRELRTRSESKKSTAEGAEEEDPAIQELHYLLKEQVTEKAEGLEQEIVRVLEKYLAELRQLEAYLLLNASHPNLFILERDTALAEGGDDPVTRELKNMEEEIKARPNHTKEDIELLKSVDRFLSGGASFEDAKRVSQYAYAARLLSRYKMEDAFAHYLMNRENAKKNLGELVTEILHYRQFESSLEQRVEGVAGN